MKPFFILFFFAFAKKQENLSRFTCLQKKKTCFDVLCTCKMARLVWRYSEDAGTIIENVDMFCMEERSLE